ncbi:MAG: hypothetical protein AB1Z57_01460, partial [Acidimicrobiia bacterium]
TAAIMAGAPFQLVVQPDEGPGAAVAEAEEAVDQAEQRLAVLEEQLAEAEERLVVEVSELEDRAQVEEHVENLRRRTMKARAKVETARGELAEILEARR